MSSISTKPADSIRRWNSKSTATPLVDRTNTQRTQKSGYSTTTAATATSSFLPELNSTPPMPTFQKPDMATLTPGRENTKGKENEDISTPTRSGYIPRRPVDACDIPSISDSRYLARRPAPAPVRAKPVATVALKDRIGETPPLPDAWEKVHDRAICVLDARGYSLQATVNKLRRTFPALKGILTPAMIDKRLQQLDQDIEIDYWRIALRSEKERKQALSPASAVPATDSSMTLTEGLPGPSRHASPSLRGGGGPSMTNLARSQSLGNMDLATVDEASSTRMKGNLVTRDFLTGFKSHLAELP